MSGGLKRRNSGGLARRTSGALPTQVRRPGATQRDARSAPVDPDVERRLAARVATESTHGGAPLSQSAVTTSGRRPRYGFFFPFIR